MLRHVQLPVAALILLALLAPGRSNGAVLAAPAGRLSVSLKATYPSPVFADTSEPIKLNAAASKLPKSESIVIGIWGGKKFTSQDARCGGGVASCSAMDSGGKDGAFTLKAAVVDKHNKILARSGSIVIRRSAHTLTVDVSDKAGTLTGDGKQLSGVTTTFTIHAPAGAPSSWTSVGLYSRQPGSSAWTLVGQLCAIGVTAFDCVRTDAQQYDPANGEKPVDYEVQALNALGTVALATPDKTITWTVWPLQVTVNGALLTKATTAKGDAIEVLRDKPAAIRVTTAVKSLKLGDQQFHIIVVQRPGNSSDLVAADCTELPCNAVSEIPGAACGDCPQVFDVIVSDKPYASSGNPVHGVAHLVMTWRLSGYQFSGLVVQWQAASRLCTDASHNCSACSDAANDPNFCFREPPSTRIDTISGYVCGDAYLDGWTIHVSSEAKGQIDPLDPKTAYDTLSSSDVTVHFDSSGTLVPGTGLAKALQPFLPWSQYMTANIVGDGNIPTSFSVSVNLPSNVAHTVLPGDAAHSGFETTYTPAEQHPSVPVTTKPDCS